MKFSTCFLLMCSVCAVAQTPMARISFDGGSVMDPSSNTAGLIGGNPATIPGVIGDAMRFDGNDRIGFSGGINNLPATGNFSVSFYFRPNYIGSQMSLFGKRTACNAINIFDVRLRADGRLAVEIRNGTQIQNLVSFPLSCPDWMHVAIVRNGGQSTLYLNGVRVAQANGMVANIGNTSTFQISNSPCIGRDGTVGYSGDLDELEVYSQALTLAQITAKASPVVTNDPGVVSGFRSGTPYTLFGEDGWYLYQWSNGDTHQDTYVSPGVYSLTVLDSTGCAFIDYWCL